MFKKALLDEVGLLDPAFVAYFEDSDLCFRARWSGWQTALVIDAIAWHRGGASIQDRLWWRTRQCYRNHALLVIKNYSVPMLWWNAGALIRERWHQFTRVYSTARTQWGMARAVVYTSAAWLGLAVRIPGAMMQRRAVMARRRISSADMQALLTGGQHDA